MASNNPPDVILELTREEAEFLLRNFDSNITVALATMQLITSRSAAVQAVELIEKFKGLRNKLKALGVNVN